MSSARHGRGGIEVLGKMGRGGCGIGWEELGPKQGQTGSRPFPRKGAIGWSDEARGMVSGCEGKPGLIGGAGGQVRDL